MHILCCKIKPKSIKKRLIVTFFCLFGRFQYAAAPLSRHSAAAGGYPFSRGQQPFRRRAATLSAAGDSTVGRSTSTTLRPYLILYIIRQPRNAKNSQKHNNSKIWCNLTSQRFLFSPYFIIFVCMNKISQHYDREKEPASDGRA